MQFGGFRFVRGCVRFRLSAVEILLFSLLSVSPLDSLTPTNYGYLLPVFTSELAELVVAEWARDRWEGEGAEWQAALQAAGAEWREGV